jgi:formylglycine-generating enzyme required for sulfatase activity
MRWCSLWLLAALAGCTDELGPRAQLLVVVDTNAPAVGQLVLDPELSVDSAVDTLRIDVLDATGAVAQFAEFVAPDAWSWPLTFGVPTTAPAQGIWLRLRVFRAVRSDPEPVAGGEALRPRPEFAIDRLVRLALPAEDRGVRIRSVLLDASCWGREADVAQDLTCVDGERLRTASSEGVAKLDEAPGSSQVGQWQHARATGCLHLPPFADAVCIAGGFSIVGDVSLESGAEVPFTYPYSGLRPVRVSPFWLDRTEFTVGRMRSLFARGDAPGVVSKKNLSHPVGKRCTWLSPDDPTMDAFPVVCLERATAEKACAFEGGGFATEAQWEHAARGRGQGRRFPWGDASPRCCTASLQQGALCPFLGVDTGPEAVGSHRPRDACDGTGDQSRDGLLDLGGNVAEWARDTLVGYEAPCWQAPGIAVDPVCLEGGSAPAARGAAYGDGPLAAAAAQRMDGSVAGPQQGFRCAYADSPPP